MARQSLAKNITPLNVPDPYQTVFQQTLWSPDLEAFMRGNNLVIRVFLPRLQPQHLKVRLDDGVLSIWDEPSQAQCGDRTDDWHENGAYHGFVRRLTLPPDIRQQDLNTTVKNGALEISLPLSRGRGRTKSGVELSAQNSSSVGD